MENKDNTLLIMLFAWVEGSASSFHFQFQSSHSFKHVSKWNTGNWSIWSMSILYTSLWATLKEWDITNSYLYCPCLDWYFSHCWCLINGICMHCRNGCIREHLNQVITSKIFIHSISTNKSNNHLYPWHRFIVWFSKQSRVSWKLD